MRKGFTLVELSIVLVIIGLLIGGILVAQSLIQSAEINAQIRQYQQYSIAIEQFKDRYKQIPGDCDICDNGRGDGDGRLESEGNVYPPHLIRYEPNLFFPDLSRMVGLQGNYTISSNVYSVFNVGKGEQFPEAELGSGGIWVTSNTSGELYFASMWGGSNDGARVWTDCGGSFGNNGFHCEGTTSSTEGLALDAKLDDGILNAGSVQAVGAFDADTQVAFQAESSGTTRCLNNGGYNLANDSKTLCRMVVKVDVQ